MQLGRRSRCGPADEDRNGVESQTSTGSIWYPCRLQFLLYNGYFCLCRFGYASTYEHSSGIGRLRRLGSNISRPREHDTRSDDLSLRCVRRRTSFRHCQRALNHALRLRADGVMTQSLQLKSGTFFYIMIQYSAHINTQDCKSIVRVKSQELRVKGTSRGVFHGKRIQTNTDVAHIRADTEVASCGGTRLSFVSVVRRPA